MTTAIPFSATVLARSREDRAKKRQAIERELDEMSEVMVREIGLLNHSQAALYLDISPARLTELVRLGKLTRYDFLGRTYVSIRELKERLHQEIKAGRPRRTVVQRVVTVAKELAKLDPVQIKHGWVGDQKARRRRKK